GGRRDPGQVVGASEAAASAPSECASASSWSRTWGRCTPSSSTFSAKSDGVVEGQRAAEAECGPAVRTAPRGRSMRASHACHWRRALQSVHGTCRLRRLLSQASGGQNLCSAFRVCNPRTAKPQSHSLRPLSPPPSPLRPPIGPSLTFRHAPCRRSVQGTLYRGVRRAGRGVISPGMVLE
ncbi:hypothetical protein BCR34DRAFT_647446, partial [Clohesyomyces aquaticus]